MSCDCAMRRMLLIAAALVTDMEARAFQVPLLEFEGGPGADELGEVVDGGADVDGDGHDDLLIASGTSGVQATGSVTVRSGKDGHAILLLVGDGVNDLFGVDAAFAGDADVDGVPDVIVAAASPGAFGPSYARLHAGADGHELQTFFPQAGDGAQWPTLRSVDGLGDVDGDGASDIVLLVQSDTSQVPSHYRVYSGGDGALLHGEASDSATIVRGVGDTNGDGVPDYAVGGPYSFPQGPGTVQLRSGLDSTLLHLWTGDTILDAFGESVDGAGDVDGDGHADVAIGATQVVPFGGFGPGYARVYSGLDGRMLREWHGDAQYEEFGRVVAPGGDVDADGWPEVLIGSLGDHDLGREEGSIRVQAGLDGTLLFQFTQGTGPFTDSTLYGLGQGVSSCGDADADGLADIALGDWSALSDGLVVGRAWIFAGRHLVWHQVPWPVESTTRPSVLSTWGMPESGNVVAIMLTNAQPKAPVIVVAGLAVLGAPFHGSTWIPTPDLLVPAGVASPTGGLGLQGHWPGSVPSGTRVFLQAWQPAPTGAVGSNAVVATSP